MERASNSEFEPLECSVYIGRRYLGRYVRVAENQYAVYDARNRLLVRWRRSIGLSSGASNERSFGPIRQFNP